MASSQAPSFMAILHIEADTQYVRRVRCNAGHEALQLSSWVLPEIALARSAPLTPTSAMTLRSNHGVSGVIFDRAESFQAHTGIHAHVWTSSSVDIGMVVSVTR